MGYGVTLLVTPPQAAKVGMGNGTNRGKGAYGGKCFNSEFMVKVWTVRTVGKVTGNCWNSRNSEIG